MLKINEVELEFELFDVDTLELYETAFAKAGEAIGENQESEKMSDVLRVSCDAVRECFDGIFGEGTGIKVCGEKLNFMKHMDAFEVIVDEAVKQRAELEGRLTRTEKKYSGNRAQRRADKK